MNKMKGLSKWSDSLLSSKESIIDSTIKITDNNDKQLYNKVYHTLQCHSLKSGRLITIKLSDEERLYISKNRKLFIDNVLFLVEMEIIFRVLTKSYLGVIISYLALDYILLRSNYFKYFLQKIFIPKMTNWAIHFNRGQYNKISNVSIILRCENKEDVLHDMRRKIYDLVKNGILLNNRQIDWHIGFHYLSNTIIQSNFDEILDDIKSFLYNDINIKNLNIDIQFCKKRRLYILYIKTNM